MAQCCANVMISGAVRPKTVLIAKPADPPRKAIPAFAGMRERVAAALSAPFRHDAVTPDLVRAANGLLSGGAWPLDLPDRLGVPRARWAEWVTRGEADFEAGEATAEADLARMLRLATAAIEACLREAVQDLAAQKGAWQAPAKLLGWLRPDAYSDKVLEAVSEQVEQLLSAARECLGDEQYEKLVRTLEGARQRGSE